MDTQFDFKLELDSRKAREMCQVMNKDELTDLVVSMYRADSLKNKWLQTFFMGELNGQSNSETEVLTDSEMDEVVRWIITG